MISATKPTLCKIDDQGRLILPEDIAHELNAKELKAAILTRDAEGFRLAFYSDEVTAKAIVSALKSMEERSEVYEALAKS